MRLLDPDVELLADAECEPDTPAGAQPGRLLDLVEAENAPEEGPRSLLAACWSGELDVVEADDLHGLSERTRAARGGPRSGDQLEFRRGAFAALSARIPHAG
jgi:hypothetical protein